MDRGHLAQVISSALSPGPPHLVTPGEAQTGAGTQQGKQARVRSVRMMRLGSGLLWQWCCWAQGAARGHALPGQGLRGQADGSQPDVQTKPWLSAHPQPLPHTQDCRAETTAGSFGVGVQLQCRRGSGGQAASPSSWQRERKHSPLPLCPLHLGGLFLRAPASELPPKETLSWQCPRPSAGEGRTGHPASPRVCSSTVCPTRDA